MPALFFRHRYHLPTSGMSVQALNNQVAAADEAEVLEFIFVLVF